mgnify:CR=1 FL=1
MSWTFATFVSVFNIIFKKLLEYRDENVVRLCVFLALLYVLSTLNGQVETLFTLSLYIYIYKCAKIEDKHIF